VTDIQNEDEVNVTEKTNESAPELNGTVKTKDDEAGKQIAAVTGTAAVIGTAATAAALNSNNEEKQEISEDGVVTQTGSPGVTASPARASSEAGTAEVMGDGDVNPPLSVKLADEAVVVEAASRQSDATGEAEEDRSISTPVTQDTAKSSEEVPREPVPDKLSTARSEDIPEQGSRPTSASPIAVNEEDGGSRPTSATVDGTIPNSASSVKEDSVPEQTQDKEISVSPTCKESSNSRPPSSTEQGTESQEDKRPVSVTAASKGASRPTSSTSPSKENADIATDANEFGTENSPPLASDKGVDGPVNDGQGTEVPGNATVPVKEDKEEETMPAGSEAVNIEVSENRPGSVAISVKEEGSRPVSAAELKKEEGSGPGVMAEDTVEVSEDRTNIRPVSAVKALEERDNVTAEGAEISKDLARTDELEDGGTRLEISSSVFTNVNSQETEGSRPINFTESTKDSETRQFSTEASSKGEETGTIEDVEVTQEATGSLPPDANKLEASENISRISTVGMTENFKGTTGSRPASVTESTKGEESQPQDATESAKEKGPEPVNSGVSNAEVSENFVESLPVSSVELTTDEGCRPATAAETITIDEEKPVNITSSEKHEESRASPLLENKVSDESAANQASSDSVKEDEIYPVRAEGPTKGGESRPESVSVDVEKKGYESMTLENIQFSEKNSVSVADSTTEEVSRTANTAVLTESTSRPTTSITGGVTVDLGERETLISEGNKNKSSTEITEKGNSTFTAVETSKAQEKSSVTVAESNTEERGSRPLSASSFKQEEVEGPLGSEYVVKEEVRGTADVSESIKEEGNGPASTEGSLNEETLESAKEESSRSETALNSTQEERAEGAAESATDGNRLVGVSVSAKDQASRPTSIVADEAGPTETVESRQDSVSSSMIQEGYSTENVENSDEQTGARSESGSELTKEEYEPTISTAVSSGEKQTETEVGNENKEVAAEQIEDLQASDRRPISTGVKQEVARTENQASSEVLTADIREETKDVKPSGEVDTVNTAPSALQSDGSKFEASKEATEQGELSSSAVADQMDKAESFTNSMKVHNDDIIPSLGATASANEPGSDKETDVLVVEDKTKNDEEESVTEDVGVGKPTKEANEELNTAATIIQATFRGYQTRQALSKPTEKDEVRGMLLAALLLSY
jgi:hypothetical protein